jgi:hypothetical protein
VRTVAEWTITGLPACAKYHPASGPYGFPVGIDHFHGTLDKYLSICDFEFNRRRMLFFMVNIANPFRERRINGGAFRK